MDKIRVLLADELTLVRAGLRLLLNGLPDIEIVAEAKDDDAAFKLAAAVQPDIILLGISRVKLDIYHLAEELRAFHPEVKIVVISDSSDEGIQHEMRDLGVAGYLPKHFDSVHFSNAIQQVVQGKKYL